MYLSNEETWELCKYILAIRDNPLLEMIYLVNDRAKKRIYVMTLCNFWDSKNLLDNHNRDDIIKLFSSIVSSFNIKNKNSRLEFHSDDISNYYNIDKKKKNIDDNIFLEQERTPLKNALILFDNTQNDIKYKKKVRNTHF